MNFFFCASSTIRRLHLLCLLLFCPTFQPQAPRLRTVSYPEPVALRVKIVSCTCRHYLHHIWKDYLLLEWLQGGSCSTAEQLCLYSRQVTKWAFYSTCEMMTLDFDALMSSTKFVRLFIIHTVYLRKFIGSSTFSMMYKKHYIYVHVCIVLWFVPIIMIR